jgi:hypothetical protein
MSSKCELLKQLFENLRITEYFLWDAAVSARFETTLFGPQTKLPNPENKIAIS